jgi:hypothetical protein
MPYFYGLSNSIPVFAGDRLRLYGGIRLPFFPRLAGIMAGLRPGARAPAFMRR